MINNNWIHLNEIEQINDIFDTEKTKVSVVFKHSTSCSISATALDRFERSLSKHTDENVLIDFYFLDLLKNRNISNAVAERSEVRHESPQALVFKEGKCVYSASHWDINLEKIMQHANL